MEVKFDKASVVDVEAKVETQAAAAPATADAAPAAAPAADMTPATAIPTRAVTVAPPAMPIAPASPMELDDDNIGFEDVILPRLNIVQKVGDLSVIFNPGEIVLNKAAVVHEPKEEKRKANPAGTGPLNITVLGFRKRQFTEKIEGGTMGALLNHEADVAKNNGTLDYKEWKASVDASKLPGGAPALRYFQRLATAVLLVERPAHIPDEDHVLFPFDCEGKFFALALWSMKGTAYTHAAKPLFTARKLGHLRKGYREQSWGLTTNLEGFNNNFAYVPVLSVGAKNSQAFKDFCADILGSGK